MGVKLCGCKDDVIKRNLDKNKDVVIDNFNYEEYDFEKEEENKDLLANNINNNNNNNNENVVKKDNANNQNNNINNNIEDNKPKIELLMQPIDVPKDLKNNIPDTQNKVEVNNNNNNEVKEEIVPSNQIEAIEDKISHLKQENMNKNNEKETEQNNNNNNDNQAKENNNEPNKNNNDNETNNNDNNNLENPQVVEEIPSKKEDIIVQNKIVTDLNDNENEPNLQRVKASKPRYKKKIQENNSFPNIFSIIPEKLLIECDNNELLFLSELKKMININAKERVRYSDRFCMITKENFIIYSSKENYITLKRPLAILPLSQITRVILFKLNPKSFDYDHFYICFDKNKNTELVYQQINTFFMNTNNKENDNEVLLMFKSENQELIKQWYVILNFLVELEKKRINEKQDDDKKDDIQDKDQNNNNNNNNNN